MAKLDKINEIVDWDNVLDIIKSVDKTSKKIGGAPHRELSIKVKMLFLQHLYNLSDPELEVEHPFGYIKEKLNYKKAVAKNKARNGLRFDFNCMLYNIFRASFLIQKAK